MIKNILFSLALALSVGSTSTGPRRVVYYPDYTDTSSFSDAYVLSNDELEYAEVFGTDDTYDYIKYTATHSRKIILETSANNNATVNVDVFLASTGTSNVRATYYSGQETQNDFLVYVQTGDTIYFRISCTANCWWTGKIHLNLAPYGYAITTIGTMYNYSLPHSGPASIYYGIKDSCNVFVPGQKYRYSDVIREAAQIWNNVGDMHFVENMTLSAFDIGTNYTDELDVTMYGTVLTHNYFCEKMNISTNMAIYAEHVDFYPNCTIFDCMVSYMLKAFGVAMGLIIYEPNSYIENVMFSAILPFVQLGSADIAAYIALWGDATISND